MTTKYAALNDNVYFWFGLNAITGGGDDGASPTFAVRLGGAASGAAPVHTGTPTLLTDSGYTPGSYEIAIAATAGNGFAANNQYGVFSSVLVSSVNPTGFVGSLSLSPVLANLTQIGSDAQSATDLKDFADAGYDPVTNKVQGVLLVDTLTTYTGNTPQTGDVFAALPTNFSALIISGGGSIGFVSGLNTALIDAAITSRMATYAQPAGFLAANFPVNIASTTNITAGVITTVTNLTNAPTNGDFTATMKASITTAVPTANAIADQVWDELLAGHVIVGSAGAALAAASSAGDPWETLLPGAYAAGTAGYLIGTYLDAAVSAIPADVLAEFQGDIIPVNVKQVNDINVIGSGLTVDPWGPQP